MSRPRKRFIATIENCIVAPPWMNNTRWLDGIASSARRFASASSITPVNHAPRWETSNAEAPTPGQRHQIGLRLVQHRQRQDARPGREVDERSVTTQATQRRRAQAPGLYTISHRRMASPAIPIVAITRPRGPRTSASRSVSDRREDAVGPASRRLADRAHVRTGERAHGARVVSSTDDRSPEPPSAREPRAVDARDHAEHRQESERGVHRGARHPRLLRAVEHLLAVGERRRDREERPHLHPVEQQERCNAHDVEEHPEVDHRASIPVAT